MPIRQAGKGSATPRRAVGMVVALGLFCGLAGAAELQVGVDDGHRKPLADAVVSAIALDAHPAVSAGKGIMDQHSSQFVPGVLAIAVGSIVTFPNSDNIRHQVYSFSPAKPFDLPLYAGTPAAPLRFEKPGVVVVGCNIHDWMIGYIVVLDTPYFAKTDAAGQAVLSLPPGRYRLETWHPRLAGEPVREELVVGLGTSAPRRVHLQLTPPPPPRRGNRRLKPAPAVSPVPAR
ncbi:methylamine utilization protein [Arenimonas oryziterrae]|nr:methylamine utilization protein [Arenimonas oryziterrae]